MQIAKRSELHKFAVIPKRWVVERSFSWLDKNRRLWKNCERKLNTSLQFIHLAFLALLYSKDFEHALRNESLTSHRFVISGRILPSTWQGKKFIAKSMES